MNLKEIKERFAVRLLDEKEIGFLFSEVEQLQKTLEWYADKTNYEMYRFNVTDYHHEETFAVWADEGERARQALKGVETE